MERPLSKFNKLQIDLERGRGGSDGVDGTPQQTHTPGSSSDPAKITEILQEVGLLRYGRLRPTKQVEAVLLDLVRAAITAGAEEGRRTLPLPDGWREAIAIVAGREVSAIDKTKLERTGRSRGGYVDVELVNKLWVARVPDGEGGTFELPQRFLRPELAAWARYQHHLQNKIPYGKFAKEIEKQRNSFRAHDESWSEHQIRANAIWSLSIDGFPPEAAFLRQGEEQWRNKAPFPDVVEQHVRRMDRVSAAPTPTLLAPTPAPAPVLMAPKQAALPEGPKLTIAQAQAEADRAREKAVVEAKEARAKRMAAKYAVSQLDDAETD